MATSAQATILQHRHSGEAASSWSFRRNEAVLNGDRIGFDAWLLPPATLGKGEALVHRLSAAMGPALLAAVLAASLYPLS